ncbi:hypothetical protein MaudCBS49596_001198 [Microsporum audouinii]
MTVIPGIQRHLVVAIGLYLDIGRFVRSRDRKVRGSVELPGVQLARTRSIASLNMSLASTLGRLEERVKRIEEKLGIPFEEIFKTGDVASSNTPAYLFRSLPKERAIPDTRVEVEGIGFESAVIGPSENKHEYESVEDGGDMAARIIDSLMQPAERDQPQFPGGWPHTPGLTITSSQLQSFLPSYSRAIEFVDYYQEHVCWAYRLLHMPTLRRHVLETYQQIGADLRPNLPVLALICAVFALSKYFSLSTSAFNGSDMSRDRSYQEYVEMASQALAVARHLEHPTVESIQTVLLVATCLLGNTGAIRSARVLAAAMYMSAQALSLHQLDSPKNKRLRQNGPYDRLELEIKRRIWWHIASTDWVFAFISGPQAGTYMVHPYQMHVDLPSNADDHEITPSSCPNKPLTEPTEVTYLIFRCKLSMLLVEFMETANKEGLEFNEMDYDQVLAFDKKIGEFIATVPYFFQHEESEGGENSAMERNQAELDKERPYLKWQRVMAQFGAYTRLSRLHRPYLALGARDPRYAYSRMACVRSARVVLEVERRMRKSIDPSTPDPSKVWAITYQVFLATAVLAMDYHFNRNEPCAEERAREILECCRTLEAAAVSSIVAARGLKKLREVAAKWGLFTGSDPKPDNQPRKESIALARETAPVQYIGSLPEGNALHDTEGGNLNLAGLWADSWDINGVLDYSQWDGVFQDLESNPGMF